MRKVLRAEWDQNCTGLLPAPLDVKDLDPRMHYEVYWDHQPLSQNMGWSELEMEVWTDGSRQLLPTESGGKALFIGAGAYSTMSELNFESQVQGEQVVV